MNKTEVLTELVDSYTTTLYNRASYLLNNTEDAEDIVQEVFIVAFERYETYKGASSLKSWLIGILKNKVADYYRKKYKKDSTISLDHYFDEHGSWKQEQMLSTWNDSDEPLFNNQDFKNVFDNCIEKIPTKWNIPIKMYYLENKKTDFLSQELGLSPTNIWKILQRGRLQLKECLEMNWFNKE